MMSANKVAYQELSSELSKAGASLVAVSKLMSPADILALYELGQRDFGENYVQELQRKQQALPADIRWHFIGHLQSNKVKFIAPFVHLIQSVDSLKLLHQIDRQGVLHDRVIQVLLQVHIAKEETKFGLDETELENIIRDPALSQMNHIQISGLMGMATFEDEPEKIRGEFRYLKTLFETYAREPMPHFQMKVLSMGMSADYRTALEEGSNMVRIGSMLFGPRPSR